MSNAVFQLDLSFLAAVGADRRCCRNRLCFSGEWEHPLGGVGGEKWVRTSSSCFGLRGLTKSPTAQLWERQGQYFGSSGGRS